MASDKRGVYHFLGEILIFFLQDLNLISTIIQICFDTKIECLSMIFPPDFSFLAQFYSKQNQKTAEKNCRTTFFML